MSESKTPRTDAIYKEFSTCFQNQELTFVTFARQLETELSAALQRAEKAEAELEWANRKMEGMIARSSSFADDLNDAICAKGKANDRAEAAERQRDRLQGVQVELCATLLRAESAERDARSLVSDLQYANNQLSRYRAAEKALPEEPARFYVAIEESVTGLDAPVVLAAAYDSLRAHAAALQAERDAMHEDAELGRIAMRFVDRAGDVCASDPAEKICQEFYEAIGAAVNARKETP